MDIATCRLLARYNAWFNTRLFDECATLDDAARKELAQRYLHAL